MMEGWKEAHAAYMCVRKMPSDGEIEVHVESKKHEHVINIASPFFLPLSYVCPAFTSLFLSLGPGPLLQQD